MWFMSKKSSRNWTESWPICNNSQGAYGDELLLTREFVDETATHTWSRRATDDCKICCHLLSCAWWNCLCSCSTWAHSPAVWGRGLTKGKRNHLRKVRFLHASRFRCRLSLPPFWAVINNNYNYQIKTNERGSSVHNVEGLELTKHVQQTSLRSGTTTLNS